MPLSSAKSVACLLFAILGTGCASQNAIDMVPEAVHLELAREQAAMAKPVRVEDMLAKARENAPGKKAGGQQPTPQTAQLQPQPADEPASSEPDKDPAGPDNQMIAAMVGSLPDRRETAEGSAPDAMANDPMELFRQAMAMHSQGTAENDGPVNSMAAYKEQASEDEWQKLLDRGMTDGDKVPGEESTVSAMQTADLSDVTASLPQTQSAQFEYVGVMFNETMTGLASDDNLKVRLLRHGKRFPEAIVIGRIEGLGGYEAMQRALLLGQLVADASGGKPGISFDPALSSGSAELRYVKVGHQP